MFVDKKKVTPEPEPPVELTPIEEAVQANPMVEAIKAVKEILLTIKDPKNPEEPLFKTIKFRTGQVQRIKHDIRNREDAILFPAVFIHYIDIHWLQGTSNIGEGKGSMRINYVLNTLNNEDEDTQYEGMEIGKLILDAIDRLKNNYPALAYRFQLEYWDMPESFDDGVQPYWIDYQIWMRDFTTYRYRDYVNVYITHPPFTQPTDQNEVANPEGLGKYEEPDFDETSGFSAQGQE